MSFHRDSSPELATQPSSPRAGRRLAGRLWLAAHLRAALIPFLTAMGALLSGCGHAHAPCPTPTTLLDRHRSESEALQEDLGRIEEEDEALRARREEALRRIEAAAATRDSLVRASKRGRTR